MKNMNTENQNNTAAPSVTIAPRNPAKGVLLFVVTLTTFKDTRSYPCRSLESVTKLAARFIAGVVKPRPTPQAPAPAAIGQTGSDRSLRPPIPLQRRPCPGLGPLPSPRGSAQLVAPNSPTPHCVQSAPTKGTL